MSLRYQINIRVLLCSLCILLLGGSVAIWQARTAVNEEVRSSINLAVQLITIGFSQAPQTLLDEADWLPKFNSLKETRHLTIELKEPSGRIIRVARKVAQESQENQPPNWFINLVGGGHSTTEHNIITADGQQLTLIIKANPLDEITEVWQESIAFFSSLTLLTALTFLAVNLVFNKALASIGVIVEALQKIETGQYQQKLPEFSTKEYDLIAKAINHMTGELASAEQRNRALTQHSLEIQEEERQHLSQELHDELGQSLTAIKVMALTASHAKADIKQTTKSIMSVCDHLITVVRSMMHQLHPLILTELGLKAAMEDLLNHWAVRNPELSVALECPDEVDGLNQKVTIQLFRVVQECLTNIVRHAQATEAKVSLAINAKVLELQVADNGCGCNAEKVKTGFGLLGMKERVSSLGGELTIQSQPQQGMKVAVRIPLK